MILTCTASLAQLRTVSGTVRSDRDGLPLPGANVVVQGTSTGTITDVNGYYSLEIPKGDVSLQFSFIGYTPQVIPVGSSIMIDVMMTPSLSAIDEVVITSLGITREKKRITYSAQNVEAEKISKARELNPVNSLQGKVAGLDLIRSGSGVGSATRVIIRGNRSIAGNNQPLYIVDGVPFSNLSWGFLWGVQWEDGIGNINPDDIATVTVLKGPNATALYGSRASNGAIVITTRKGFASKGIGVEFNTNLSMDKALILTRYQHVYGQGNGGVYNKNSEQGWGAKMEGQMVEYWSPDPNWAGPSAYQYLPHKNFEEFFVTGYNLANTLTLNGGSDKLKMLFSYTNTNAGGIVETNKLRRNNFHLRFDGNLTPKLSLDTKLTYFNERVDNRLANDDFALLKSIYLQPSNISLEQAREFEYFDDAGFRHQNYWSPNQLGIGVGNIYWMLNRTSVEEINNRIIGMGSLRYQFTKGLSLMIRSSFDNLFNTPYSTKRYNNTRSESDDGDLTLTNFGNLELNNDFLLNYNGKFGKIISIDLSFGGNMLYQKRWWTRTATNRLLKPDLFYIKNTSQVLADQAGSEKKVHSLYGFATIGLKDFIFLDITGRNDWSSTLPKENWSYFYPSVGLTWILSEMLASTPDFLTFAKVRANYAVVGNDTYPYIIHKNYSFEAGGNHGYIRRDQTLPAENLKPENTRSIELGADLKFFYNRLGVDFTLYKTNTFNQLLEIPLPSASGYNSKFINAGNLQNRGIEIILSATPVREKDFSWDIVANFAKNENLCLELTDELDEYMTGGDFFGIAHKIVEGEPVDQIYGRGFYRNETGRILINDLGLPLISPGNTIPLGHSNPDWTGGLTNRITWKGLTLSALIDVRMGGDVFSYTEALLTFNGFSEATLAGRDGMIVDGVVDVQDYEQNPDGDPIYEENTIETTAEKYWLAMGGVTNPVQEPYRYDASYVRLREILLGYNWNLKTSLIQSIQLSLFGRNLGFLYNASKIIDPGISFGIGNLQGVQGFSPPTSRTFGVNANFKF